MSLMVKSALVAIIVIAPALAIGQSLATAQANMKDMEWLLGDWVRTNSKPGTTGFETWRKHNNQEWRGRGVTVNGKDTTFVELLKILVKGNKLYYIADVPDNSKPVYFEITMITKDTFTCENPSHDFPKKIHYRFDGTQVYARVSAGDQGIDYFFERTKR